MAAPWEYFKAPASSPKGPWEQFALPDAGKTTASAGFKPEMAAPLEMALQLGTGALAEPVAGIAGLLSTLIPGSVPAGDVVRQTRNNLTYQPRTEAGKQMLPELTSRVVDATPEMIRRPVVKGAQEYSQFEGWVADNYGPAAGAAVATLPTALLEAIPAGLAIRKMRAADAPMPNQFQAQLAQNAPIPEQAAPSAAEYQQVASDLKAGRTERAAAAVNPDDQILKDAETLGIDLNPSHYSTNRAYIDLEQSLKSRPGSLLQTKEERAIIDLGNRADDLIDSMGGMQDKSALDDSLMGEFSSTMTGLNQQSDALYQKVNEAIPRATRVVPDGTRAFLDDQIAELGDNTSLLTSAEQSLQRLFKKNAEGEIENPTYAAIDRVRRDIGSAIGSRSGPFKDDDTGQLRRLYAVLAEDQQKFADAFGVGNEYKDAQALVKQRKRLEDEAITLFGRELQGSIIPKLRQSATTLTKGDVSKLNSLMESVPEARRGEVAATLLNDIFTLGARRNAPIGQGFVNAFTGLNRNQGAKDALFSYLPPNARERFDRIGRVATGIYQAKALENTSKSARDIIGAMDDGGMFGKIYGVGKKVAVAEGVSSAIGLPGAGTAGVVGSILSKGVTPATKAADELITSAAFKDAVIESAVGRGAKQAKLINSPEYESWLMAQNPSIKAEIAAMGFVPWLTSGPGKAEESQGQE